MSKNALNSFVLIKNKYIFLILILCLDRITGIANKNNV